MDNPHSLEIEASPSEEPVESMPLVVTELYDAMRQDISFEKKAKRALKIGRLYLGVASGYLTRIDRQADYWEALVSDDSPEMQFPPERELDLESTYCRRVLHSSSQIALTDAPEQGWDDDPAYEAHGLHSYIGTPIQVNNEQYGTVFFADEEPREAPYSEDEKMLVELISHMLAGELERNQFEAQLTKETNLSLVLNRVLRHNFRNEMSIIRGNTQMMADELPDSQAAQSSLQSIDRLIEICENARALDKIVASDRKRDRTNIRTIVEGVIADVRSEYSSASISIEAGEEATGAVFPSFEQALRELIENAAKHSGTEPTITVTVESVPNAVEIEVSDDGPGIADQEIEVLSSGSETPLMHGSGLGLWLAHWIVSRHDGSIEASVTEAGTTLTITVPRAPLAEGNEQVSELVRARDQHKAAFDEAGDGMIIADDEARILDVNQKAARVLGVDSQETLGRSVEGFLPPDFDFEAEWRELQAVGQKREEMNIVSDGGERSTIEYTARADIVPGQHLIVLRDITEQKEHERTLETKTEAIDEAPVGFTITDPNLGDHPIIYANEEFCDLTGYRPDEVVGRNCRFLQGPETDPETVAKIRNGIATESPVEVEIRNYRKDGTEFWNHLRIAPVHADSGEVEYFVGFQTDITEYKQRQQSRHGSTERDESNTEMTPGEVIQRHHNQLNGGPNN